MHTNHVKHKDVDTVDIFLHYALFYTCRYEGAGSHWTTGHASTISTCPQLARVTVLESLESFFRASLVRVGRKYSGRYRRAFWNNPMVLL